MHETIELTRENGESVTGNVVARFSNKNNEYVAFTIMEDGVEEFLVSKYEKTQDGFKMIEIKDDEWDFINSYLEENVYGSDLDE